MEQSENFVKEVTRGVGRPKGGLSRGKSQRKLRRDETEDYNFIESRVGNQGKDVDVSHILV